MEVIVGVSNRHVHLTKEDYEILFHDIPLEKTKDLRQPLQYASNQTVAIKGLKDTIENVRIIGPFRHYTQVELSKTDSVRLGVPLNISLSGDLEKASLVTIIGPYGEITKACAIQATRHIHMTKEEQKDLGLDDKNEVSIEVEGSKGAVLHHVLLKVQENSCLECHLDLDDANATLLTTGSKVTIIK